jgi:O-antigen ligase
MIVSLLGLITVVVFFLLSPLNGLVAWSFFAPFFDTVIFLNIGSLIPQLTFNRFFFFAILVLYFFSKRAENSALPPEKGRIEKYMLLFALVFIAEIYLHYRPKDGTRNAIGFFESFVGPFILFSMARYYVRSWRSVDKILNALLAMGFVLALMGIYEQITKIDLLNFLPVSEDVPEGLQGLRGEEHWVRSNGAFPTPESYGITLAMLFFVGLYKLKTADLGQGEPVIKRTLLLVVISVIAVGVFCSMFRNIWLGVMVGLLIASILRPGKKFVRTASLVAVFLGLLLFMKVISGGSNLATGRVFVKETMYSRIGSFNIAFQAFRENPLFGLGYNQFEQYAKNHTEDLAYKDVRAAKQAHNTFLSALAENGIIGFIPFLLFWLAVVRSAAELYRKAGAGREKDLTLTLLSCAAALITPWFFERTGYYAPLNNVFFLILGTVAGVLHWEHKGDYRAAAAQTARPRIGRMATGGTGESIVVGTTGS